MLRISSLLFILLSSSQLFSQEGETRAKYKPAYGFSVGLNQSALFNSNDKNQLTIKNGLGFRLGVNSNFPIKNNWSIAPKAELSFNNATITENNISYKVDPQNLDFMAHVKYRFKGYNSKVKPYCYFGPNIRVPLRNNSEEPLYATKTSLAMDFAFGVDIELQHFLLSPEIRFSGGLTDIRKNAAGKLLHGSNASLILNFSSK